MARDEGSGERIETPDLREGNVKQMFGLYCKMIFCGRRGEKGLPTNIGLFLLLTVAVVGLCSLKSIKSLDILSTVSPWFFRCFVV